MRIRKAVVIATQNSPLAVPTEVMPLIDKPIIQYVIDEISQAGIEEVLIVLGDNSDAIIKLFEKSNRFDYDTATMTTDSAMVYFSRYSQTGDYGGAVLSAKRFVGDAPFALLNGTQIFTNQTEPVIKQVVESYHYMKHSVLGLQRGEALGEIVETAVFDEDYYSIKGIADISLPADSNKLHLCGRSVLRPEIFGYLELQSAGTGRSSFIKAMDDMMKDQRFYGVLIPGGKHDLNTQTGYIKSVIDLALDHKEYKAEIERHIGERLSQNQSV